MNNFLWEVADNLNLHWAWEKVRRSAQTGDDWFDEIELADFELELDKNLHDIRSDFLKGKYHLTPLKPIPYPKQANKKGNPRSRQMFKFAVRDQVAWVAVVNVIGPHIDALMPPWSYGNRLYRTIWIEEDSSGSKVRKIGNYRHVSGQIYLPFRQSWPVFRRHVYLTTRAMMRDDITSDLDENEKEELETQKRLDQRYKCPFVMPEYWENKQKKTNGQEQELYWCSVDLEKFYPSLKIEQVSQNILSKLPEDWTQDANVLLKRLFNFKLDLKSWSDDELKEIGLTSKRKTFPHIPTGLYVAGFLANAGMLSIDLKISEQLESSRIAHFRFVDDHILLAYNFNELMEWIENYENILGQNKTGIKINPEKVEPNKLRDFLAARNSKNKKVKSDKHEAAKSECLLDPNFPSPLMTKTIALVSGIARTDFNLLDSNDIANLSDQLELLLLVDLPEEEIPEKTRFSFAAMRLSMLAEHRLARNPDIALLRVELESLKFKERSGCSDHDVKKAQTKIRQVKENINKENHKLENEAKRTFQLLRKVLRERPELIRIWNRAVLMCRMTGVKGLHLLWNDIKEVKNINSLTREYLQANFLRLLAGQAVLAARIVVCPNTPHWRVDASKRFLDELSENSGLFQEQILNVSSRKILSKSWRLYSFGLLCSRIILDSSQKEDFEFELPQTFGNSKKMSGPEAATWVWWVARKTLRDLDPHAALFVRKLGEKLEPSRKMAAFWRFFPLDISFDRVGVIAEVGNEAPEGWWYDALRSHTVPSLFQLKGSNKRNISKASRAVLNKTKTGITLYEWCEFVRKSLEKNPFNPKCGEWTALEIVKQIAKLTYNIPSLESYLESRNERKTIYLHPANFKLPRVWMEDGDTWDKWKRLVTQKGIKPVAKNLNLKDQRYAPITINSFFTEVNNVRGLGLILYGLLRCGFDLPSIWNGPGHAEVLNMLPRILLTDVTCSSWTLGVLQSCLQPRVTENIYLSRKCGGLDKDRSCALDADTEFDPIVFTSSQHVVNAIEICQKNLEKYQISTLNQNARQLTPVSIQELTSPHWNRVFQHNSVNFGEDNE